jgi:poly(3-hydroxyoctanoate) depolymerase
MEGTFVAWRGHRVYVKVTGQGDPLLLITGLGGSTDQWAPFAQQFQHRQVIRFDVPGMGLSSAPYAPIPVTAVADLAVAVLDDLGVERADVLGYSYGGAVAQQLAFEHPERLCRLVLAATNCGIGAVPGSYAAMASLATTLRYYSPMYFDRTAATLYGGVTGRDRSMRRRIDGRAAAAPSVGLRLSDAAARYHRLVESAVPRQDSARHAGHLGR